MSKFPALSGVLNSGERAEDPQNCLQSSAQNYTARWAKAWAEAAPQQRDELLQDVTADPFLTGEAKAAAWEKLGWIIFPVDYSDPLERLLAHALDPETCAQCGAFLKIERFCRTTLMETCPNCDCEYDA